MADEKARTSKGKQLTPRTNAAEEMRAVIVRLDEAQAWDHLQARDLDPALMDFVAGRIQKGLEVSDICRELGIRGGKASRQWKKIQANFRMGLRADAEVYLSRATRQLFVICEKARLVLEDAFENGTPVTETDLSGNVSIVRVKGATKELATFLEAYGKAVERPVKLWKDFGAIGETVNKATGGGSGGVTIVVQNRIPMPSEAEIKAHQEEMRARMTQIEVKAGKPDVGQS